MRRLPLRAAGYIKVNNVDGFEVPVCEACFVLGCYMRPRIPRESGQDCKRVFSYRNGDGIITEGQCCCYGHADGGYLDIR